MTTHTTTTTTPADRDACAALARVWDAPADDIQARVHALEAEVDRLTLALRWATLTTRGVRLPGHWLVRDLDPGWSATWIGAIPDLDRARLRVALQTCHAAATAAVLALRTPNQDCNVPVIDHRRHRGPCATNPSASDVVMAVLDAVARELADDDDAQGEE